MGFIDDVNEDKEMIKYQVRTKMKLEELKTEKDFTRAIRKELGFYGAINSFGKFIYSQRKSFFELNNRFNKGELYEWSFKDLDGEFNYSKNQSKKIDEVNKSYQELTGEDYPLYEQCRRIIASVLGHLTTEIQIREIEGGF